VKEPRRVLMKLSFVSLSAVVLGTAWLSAQTPQNGEKVTVAGCLQRAERNGSIGGTIVGTSASPNTAAQEANSGALVDAYLLTEAKPVVAGVQPESGATPSSATGTTATGTSGKADITTYGLSGREDELSRHPGARLEVTGTIEPPVTSGRGTGGQTTATGAKRIKVESFKILADKCQAQ
jgi:hypothetical protein